MHYWMKNIGTYRRKTAHLSLVEHGIYNQLLDTYYMTEQPLDLNKDKLRRLHCVRTESEVEAFFTILDEFFVKTENGYRHYHADEQLEKIYEKSEKARKSAEIRWQKKREDLASTIEECSDLSSDDSVDDAESMQTGSERNANASETDPNASESDANDMRPVCYTLPITQNPLPNEKTCPSLDELFVQFWDAGMRKDNKKKSRSAFMSLMRKHSIPVGFTEFLINDIQARLKAEQPNFDRMLPSTYINGERWKDTFSAENNKRGNSNETNQRSDSSGNDRLEVDRQLSNPRYARERF